MDWNQSDTFSTAGYAIQNGLQGFISLETREIIEDVFSCGFLPVIFFVGLFGNVASIIVLSYQGTHNATNVLLIGLAITDLLFVILSFAVELKCLIRQFSERLAINVDVISHCYLFIPAYVIGRISSLFICLIAIERYIVVKYPLKANRVVTRRNVVVSMIAVYLLGFALCGCLLNGYEVKESFNTNLNTTVFELALNRFFADNFNFLILYMDIFLSFVFRFLPVGLVLFCTCSIILELKRSAAIRSDMTRQICTKQELDQQKTTKTLLSICFLFIVCTVPGLLNAVVRLLFSQDGYADVGRYQNIASVAVTVIFVFIEVNSSANFILYIMTNSRFAATFRKLFMCGWKMKDQRQETV